jgi:membrane protein YqaA with SNARE-associated domain
LRTPDLQKDFPLLREQQLLRLPESTLLFRKKIGVKCRELSPLRMRKENHGATQGLRRELSHMTDLRHPHPRLRALRMHHPQVFHWLVHLSFAGVFVVAVIDFSLIPLPIPNATDLLLLALVARGASPWVLVPSAVAGGILGAYTTWHVGSKGGRRALRRYGSIRLVKHLCVWMEHHPMLAALIFPMLPPPIPLSTFVLAAGALGVARRRFFAAFTVALTLRYSLLAWLGMTYGRRIVRLWAATIHRWSPALLWILGAPVVAGIGLAAWHVLAKRQGDARRPRVTEIGASGID